MQPMSLDVTYFRRIKRMLMKCWRIIYLGCLFVGQEDNCSYLPRQYLGLVPNTAFLLHKHSAKLCHYFLIPLVKSFFLK